MATSIMDRIRKCLNLADVSKGATEAEAIAAMAAAKRLMAEHNLSMTDIEVKEEVASGATEATDGLKRKDHPVWEQYMAVIADTLFGTKHYFSQEILRNAGGFVKGYTRRVKFIGVGHDAQVAAEAYTILVDMVWNMGYGHEYKGKEHTSYCMGVVQTMAKRAHDQVKDATPTQEQRCREIMVVKDQAIAQHMKKLALRPMRKSNPTVNGAAYAHGKLDGANVDMNFRRALR